MSFAELKKDDLVFVDTRSTFLGDSRWVPVVFVRWTREYVPGCVCSAIVVSEHRLGSLCVRQHVDGSYLVQTPDMKLAPSP